MKEECCSCGYVGEVYVIPAEHGHAEHKHCEVCYGSHAGKVCEYPNQYDATARVVTRTIAECTNMILFAIRNPQPEAINKIVRAIETAANRRGTAR